MIDHPRYFIAKKLRPFLEDMEVHMPEETALDFADLALEGVEDWKKSDGR